MTKTTNARLGTSAWSADTDTWPGRTGINTELATINANAAIWGQGTTAARPVAAYSGRFYWATDTSRLWYDNGTLWTEVSPVGGGGTPNADTIGNVGAEGSSRIAARADHTHALPVPSTDPAAVAYSGAMSRGTSTTVARSDHTHALAALPLAASPPGAVNPGVAGVTGSSTNLARQDHTHTTPSAVQFLGGSSGGMFTGTAPANLGLLRFYAFRGTFGTDANGGLAVTHSGILNGTTMPVASFTDAGTNQGAILPWFSYSTPGQTMFRVFNSAWASIAFGTFDVICSVWGW